MCLNDHSDLHLWLLLEAEATQELHVLALPVHSGQPPMCGDEHKHKCGARKGKIK